jgi:predicted nucleic acid-binding protein
VIYADTSFLIALKVPIDTFHQKAVPFYEEHQEEIWLWSPWQRVEAFNTLRQLTKHPDQRRRLSVGSARTLISSMERDVRLGYFTHMEADWRDVLRAANETSIAHAFDLPCFPADLLHVAYALELCAASFVTYDDEQLNLANACGLKAVRPR